MLKGLALAGAVVLAAGCGRSFTSPGGGFKPLDAYADPPGVAPHGISHIHPSGGSGSYHLKLPIQNTRSGDPRIDDTDFTYRAGGVGNCTDVVIVQDLNTGEEHDVPIQVGGELSLTPVQLIRAPLQTWSFTKAGGQAPYCFTVRTEGSECAGVTTPVCGPDAGMVCGVNTDGGTGSCIDGQGNYVARSCGGGLDVVEVTDATNLSIAQSYVSISSALELEPQVITAQPGGVVFFQASGGVPPYRYGFTLHGNQSEGTIGVAGDYTAGPNEDVEDEIVLTDSVNAQVRARVVVGGTSAKLPLGAGYRLVVGDFNGDGRPDVVALADDSIETGGSEALGSVEGIAEVRSFSLAAPPVGGSGAPLGAAVADFNGDGTDDLALLQEGGRYVYEIQVMLGRRDGSFDILPPVSLGAAGTATVVQPYLAASPLPSTQAAGDPGRLLTVEADPGTGATVMHAYGLDSANLLTDAGVFPLPPVDLINDAYLLSTTDPRGGPQIHLGVGDEHHSGQPCASSDGFSAYEVSVDHDPNGGLAVSYQPEGCVPVTNVEPTGVVRADPSDPTLGASYLFNDYGDTVLARARTTGYHLIRIPGDPDPDSSIGNSVYVPVAPNYLGTTYTDVYYQAELDRIHPDHVERVQLLDDGGLASRTDDIAAPIWDVASLDMNSDSLMDLVTVDQAGALHFLRGAPYGFAGLGHTFAIPSAGATLFPVDLDADGKSDVVVFDPRASLLLGNAGGHLAQGPSMEPGINHVAGGTGSGRAAWFIRPADGGVGGAIDRVTLDGDGGTQVTSAELPLLDVLDGACAPSGFCASFPLPVSAAQGGVLVRGYSTNAGGQLYGVLFDGGALGVVDVNPQLGSYASFNTVVPVDATGGPVDDLLVWQADGFSVNQLEIHPARSDGTFGWATSPSATLDLSGYFGVGGWVGGLFPLSTAPGGRPDRALAVLVPDDGNGSCDFQSDSVTLLVVHMESGQIQVEDTYSWSAGDPSPWNDPCSPLAWSVGSGDFDGDGKVDVTISDNNNLALISSHQGGLGGLRFIPSGGVPASVAFGDVDGDGLQDIVYTFADRAEVTVLLGHNDGRFY